MCLVDVTIHVRWLRQPGQRNAPATRCAGCVVCTHVAARRNGILGYVLVSERAWLSQPTSLLTSNTDPISGEFCLNNSALEHLQRIFRLNDIFKMKTSHLYFCPDIY